MSDLERDLEEIRAEVDGTRKNLRVAELVSGGFRALGCEPVVVGGSAVEVYTEGQYVSGDIDICYTGVRMPTPREREEVMSRLGRPLSLRQWDVAGVMVDILGRVETTARTPFQNIGALTLIQIEELIAERLLVATVPSRNEERFEVVRILIAMLARKLVSVDFAELLRVADSPDYRVGSELRALLSSANVAMTDADE